MILSGLGICESSSLSCVKLTSCALLGTGQTFLYYLIHMGFEPWIQTNPKTQSKTQLAPPCYTWFWAKPSFAGISPKALTLADVGWKVCKLRLSLRLIMEFIIRQNPFLSSSLKLSLCSINYTATFVFALNSNKRREYNQLDGGGSGVGVGESTSNGRTGFARWKAGSRPATDVKSVRSKSQYAWRVLSWEIWCCIAK